MKLTLTVTPDVIKRIAFVIRCDEQSMAGCSMDAQANQTSRLAQGMETLPRQNIAITFETTANDPD